MKKALLVLAAMIVLGPLFSSQAFADSRGSLTVSATFGNLAIPVPVYAPSVRHYPPPQVIVVEEPRYEKKHRHGKRYSRRDHHECNSRDDGYRRRHQEPAVVYYYPEYRGPRGYHY